MSDTTLNDYEIPNLKHRSLQLLCATSAGIILLILTYQLSTLITNCLLTISEILMSPNFTRNATEIALGVSITLAIGAIARAHINHSNNARFVAEKNLEVQSNVQTFKYAALESQRPTGVKMLGNSE